MAVQNAARPSARERLLAAANELFYEEGVHTVGIDRVIEQAGVAKGSLYNTFGSKDELIHAYLEGRHERIAERITRALESYDTPRDRLVGVFEAQGRSHAETGYRGCAFVRASAESHPGDRIEQAYGDYRGLGALPVHPPGRGGRGARPGGPGPPAAPALRRDRGVGPDGPRSRRVRCGPAPRPGHCSTRPSPARPAGAAAATD